MKSFPCIWWQNTHIPQQKFKRRLFFFPQIWYTHHTKMELPTLHYRTNQEVCCFTQRVPKKTNSVILHTRRGNKISITNAMVVVVVVLSCPLFFLLG